MTVNHRILYGGVFLIATGAVMLVAQWVAIDVEDLAQALRLWPVLLVALGVGLLLHRTRFDVAGGMLAAAVPGLVLGGMLAAAPVTVARSGVECNGVRPASFATRQGTFNGAASVDLRLDCGEVSVTTAPGNGWQLEAGNGSGALATVDVSAGRLSVASASRGHPFGFVRGSDVWRLSLPVANRLDLTAEVNAVRGRFDMAGARLGNVRLAVNAGDAHVDLARATVGHLSMSVGAGSVSLSLPEAQDIGVVISVNAGVVKICAPRELGLRIHHDGVLAATSYGGLVRSGDAWESPGYSMATHHANVTVTANVGSVDVNPMGDCQ